MRKSEAAANRCKTISMVQKLLGGKYKIELLWYIGKCDIQRFGQLRRQIGEITESCPWHPQSATVLCDG